MGALSEHRSDKRLCVYYRIIENETNQSWLENFLNYLCEKVYQLEICEVGSIEMLQNNKFRDDKRYLIIWLHRQGEEKENIYRLTSLGENKINIKVFIFYEQFDPEIAAEVWFHTNCVIGYEPYSIGESEKIKEEIRKIISKEIEIASAGEDESGKPIGSLFPLPKGSDYAENKYTSLFIGGTRELLLQVRDVIECIKNFKKRVNYPSTIRNHLFFPSKKKEDIFSQILKNGYIGENLENIPELVAKNFPPPSILLLGETGTGKSLLAELIHWQTYASESNSIKEEDKKEAKRFVGELFQHLNCAALTESLVDGELFGYPKGAYTGAESDYPGRIFSALYGTLFLDEIGNMPIQVQAKLLTFMDSGYYYPLKSSSKIYVACTIIAATNKPLDVLMEKGEFLRELFERFRFKLYVPSLKERIDHLEMLIDFVLQDPTINPKNEDGSFYIKSISDGAINKLKSYGFPGNFRELQSILQNAVRLAKNEGKRTILSSHIVLPI